jgi:hypothetical protein
MRLRNPLTPTRAQAAADSRYVQLIPTQVELIDNTVENVALADASSVRSVSLEYSFILPISGKTQTGELDLSHTGGTAQIIGHEYHYDETDGEFPGLSFAATIVGANLCLEITLAAIGENPLFAYKLIEWPISAL